MSRRGHWSWGHLEAGRRWAGRDQGQQHSPGGGALVPCGILGLCDKHTAPLTCRTAQECDNTGRLTVSVTRPNTTILSSVRRVPLETVSWAGLDPHYPENGGPRGRLEQLPGKPQEQTRKAGAGVQRERVVGPDPHRNPPAEADPREEGWVRVAPGRIGQDPSS